MDLDSLRKLAYVRPFIPLRVHLKDGRTLTVLYPEHIKIGPMGIHLFTPTKDRARYMADAIDIVQITDIAWVETLTPATTGSDTKP